MGGKLITTPVEVLKVVERYARDKRFCELKYGKKGFVCEYMRGKASESCCVDVRGSGYNGNIVSIVPDSDIYYMWVGKPSELHRKLKRVMKDSVFLIGANEKTKEYEYVYKHAHEILKITCNHGNFYIGVFDYVHKT